MLRKLKGGLSRETPFHGSTSHHLGYLRKRLRCDHEHGMFQGQWSIGGQDGYLRDGGVETRLDAFTGWAPERLGRFKCR